MGEKLPPDQLELYRRTDEVLHYIWDPIGIAGAPDARDEYQSYLPEIFQLLIAKDEVRIREYLAELVEHMGMKLSEDQQTRIDHATKSLLQWRAKGVSD